MRAPINTWHRFRTFAGISGFGIITPLGMDQRAWSPTDPHRGPMGPHGGPVIRNFEFSAKRF